MTHRLAALAYTVTLGCVAPGNGSRGRREITVMRVTLAQLRDAANAAENDFRALCTGYGFTDEWAAYRADLRGEIWPAEMTEAHASYITKLHAFYTMRDGPNGFLGARAV